VGVRADEAMFMNMFKLFYAYGFDVFGADPWNCEEILRVNLVVGLVIRLLFR
jgi:hypothetical protein